MGIREDAIQKVCENPMAGQYPISIAEGITAVNGSDSYLLNEIHIEKKVK
ncbi:FapA family protein [Cytobacillus sp. NCCP-133]|nr:FapA family protein [Cytobacillus sp. NCCP-133]